MDISKRSFIIVTHQLVYGAPQALRDFLEQRGASRVVFIAHPLQSKEEASFVEVSSSGAPKEFHLCGEQTRYHTLNYALHFFRSLYLSWRYARHDEIYFGINPLNGLAGILLKKIGRVKRVIFYSIDFTPERFSSRIINNAYHAIDRFCANSADEVWSVSPEISRGRELLHGNGAFARSRQYIVPIGIWFGRVKRLPISQVKRNQLLFVGHLLEKQGVQLVIQAIPSILTKIPDFRLMIIGGGEFEPHLRNLVATLGLATNVEFTGWVFERPVLDDLMSDSAAAIAPYLCGLSSFTKFADPTKLKDYLSAGLPIIMTDVPFNARELERRGCAVVVEESVSEIAAAVVAILSDHCLLERMRANAVKYIRDFDWENIFDKNIGRIMKLDYE